MVARRWTAVRLLAVLAALPPLSLGAGCRSTREKGGGSAGLNAQTPEARPEPDGIHAQVPGADLGPDGWSRRAPAPAYGVQPESSGPKADAERFPIHGLLVSRYEGRFTGGVHDHDLVETLSLELGDKTKNPVTGFVMAEGLADLDGNGSDPNGTFHSLADTYDGAVTARLYHAYADLHVSETFETLRVGRQMIVDTPVTVYFDGARVETKELGKQRFRFGAYGGIPVETYAPGAGEEMLGFYGETRPWRGGRIRADWIHSADEGSFGARENDLFGIGGSQSFGKSLRFDLEHTRLESEARDLRVRGTYYAEDSDLVLQASFFELLQTQKDFAVPFDPFYATLLDLFPYTEVGFLASKSLGPHFDVQTGLDLRRVTDAQDVGTYNHDFDRFFATTDVRGLLPASLDLSLTGEVWDSTTNHVETYGAGLTRKFGATLEAGVGTYYAMYKYDLFQQRELDDVRTWYLSFDWKRSVSVRFDLRYEFEDDPDAEYHSVRLGATWRF
jgi:hypothetical protein